ncbi:MAG: 5'-nucleotidase [Gammaproteobacteria bacterium]|jgi:5'-nucleotidase
MGQFPKRILLSNDDGYSAPGLASLFNVLSQFAEVVVVAPDRDRSGASNSLTLSYPVRASRRANGFIAVEGTPTDCVHLALTGLIDHEPDVVVSGINAGPNLGDDVVYSGTVAAAMEGRHLGIPAIAVSLGSHQPTHYDTAAWSVKTLLSRGELRSLAPQTILNVNVPDVPLEALAGFQATRLGNRHLAEGMVRDTDPRGREIYWIGPPGPEQDAGEGTDFHAVRHGFVSITPLHIDLTRHEALGDMSSWVSSIPPPRAR